MTTSCSSPTAGRCLGVHPRPLNSHYHVLILFVNTDQAEHGPCSLGVPDEWTLLRQYVMAAARTRCVGGVATQCRETWSMRVAHGDSGGDGGAGCGVSIWMLPEASVYPHNTLLARSTSVRVSGRSCVSPHLGRPLPRNSPPLVTGRQEKIGVSICKDVVRGMSQWLHSWWFCERCGGWKLLASDAEVARHEFTHEWSGPEVQLPIVSTRGVGALLREAGR